jgi:hypothetical protein
LRSDTGVPSPRLWGPGNNRPGRPAKTMRKCEDANATWLMRGDANRYRARLTSSSGKNMISGQRSAFQRYHRAAVFGYRK